jgi:hypothetical protein
MELLKAFIDLFLNLDIHLAKVVVELDLCDFIRHHFL